MMKKRVEWLDALRGIGVLLVVLGHISERLKFVEWIYLFHMPLFFFSGGWLFRKRDVLADVKRRAASVIVPYISFGIILFVYWFLIERRFRNADLSAWENILGLVLGRYDMLEFNIHIWFLPCFFVVSVLYNILVNSIKRSIIILPLCVLSTVIALLCSLPELIWCLNRVVLYVGYFALGDFVSSHWKEEYENKTNTVQNLIIGFAIWLLVLVLAPLTQSARILMLPVALIGIGGTVALSLAFKKCKILQYVGHISLVVLCVHGPIYRVLLAIVSKLCGVDVSYFRNNLLMTFLMSIVTCSICAIVYEIVSRYMPWMIGLPRKKCQLDTVLDEK